MRNRHFVDRKRQSGVVLFIALMVLVLMTLAGLALVRSSGSGLLVAGNLTFKKNATMSADAGIEAALTWIDTNSAATREQNVPLAGYYAVAVNTDPEQWTLWANGARTLAEDTAGNTVRIVIHRMCDGLGPVETNSCSSFTPMSACAGKGPGDDLGVSSLGCPVRPYNRVTVQVTGPRNTVSYVQAMVY